MTAATIKYGPSERTGSNGCYGQNRLCDHVLTGRIEAPKFCTRNRECYHCQFDQILDEMDPAANN